MKLQCLTSLIVIAVLTVPALGQSRQVPGKGVSTPVLLINTTVQGRTARVGGVHQILQQPVRVLLLVHKHQT